MVAFTPEPLFAYPGTIASVPVYKLSLVGKTTYVAVGDSFTVGNNASPLSNSFVNLFTTAKGLAVTNLAIGGRGAWSCANSIQSTGFTRGATVVHWMGGFNDLRRNGLLSGGNFVDPRVVKKIEAGLRAVILKAIGGVSTAPGGSSLVTRTGTFAAYAANTVGGTYQNGTLGGSNIAAFTSTDGSKWTWTFTGTGFGIQFIANSGDVQTFGTADVYIDGVLNRSVNLNNWYDNVSDGSYDNRRGPLGQTWHGLSAGSHTVEVVSHGGIVAIDYFTILQTLANSGSFIVWDIPYMDATGYALSPNQGSVAATDLANAVQRSVVSEFRGNGYNIVAAPSNSFYVLATGLDSDHIHPNNTGHGQFFDCGVSVCA